VSLFKDAPTSIAPRISMYGAHMNVGLTGKACDHHFLLDWLGPDLHEEIDSCVTRVSAEECGSTGKEPDELNPNRVT
jgi:hypothetical protein